MHAPARPEISAADGRGARSALARLSMRAALAAFAWWGLASTASADTLIVLNKSDATATLIDRASGAAVATLPTGDGPHEVAVSPDGATAVVANYGRRTPGSTLTVIDVAKAEVTDTVELGEHRRPHGIRYLPDGRCVVVTVEHNRKVLLVDIPARKILAAIDTDADVSHMVATTANARRAFVANIGSGSVTVLDLVKRRRVRNIATGAGAEGIAVSPDGAEVWVSNRSADTVTILDAATLEVRATLESASFPIRVEFTPDGAHVLVSNAKSGDVTVFDAARRKVVQRITMGEGHAPIGILIPPVGGAAYVANTQANTVTVIDMKTWKVTGTLRAGTTPDGMAYSPVAATPRKL